MTGERPSVGIGIFVWKDGKFLMGKRVGKHGLGTWSVPGGYLEYGETFEECAARETMEETGVKIKNTIFLTATNNIFPDEQKHSITIYMRSDLADGDPKTIEHDKFAEVGWFTPDNLPGPLFLPIKELKRLHPELLQSK
jgi:8-oxo-dGTP diphosphatase